MTEPGVAANRSTVGLTEFLRARLAAVVREDLAVEASAGFPLLSRFPNSEVAGVPDYVSRLSATGEAHDLQWVKAPPR